MLIILCAGVLGWALLRADAAWNHFAAQTVADAVHAAERPVPADIELALDYNDRALRRFAGQPDYLDLRGYLLEAQAGLPGTLGGPRQELLGAAADSYRRALHARPLWPYSWGKLLSVKDKLGEVDSEFNTALERAAATGPWEPRVQMQVVRSGLRHWEELTHGDRGLVRATMQNALKVQPREVFEVVRFYARPEVLCGLDSDQPQIERWCSKVLQGP